MRSGLSSVFKFKASQCLLLSKAPSNTRPKLGVEQGQELQAATGVSQPGVSHPLCSPGDQASSAQHKADTPAFQGAQCPTCSSLWISSLSSIPRCRRCGMTSLGLPQEQGECLAHPWGSSFLPRAVWK